MRDTIRNKTFREELQINEKINRIKWNDRLESMDEKARIHEPKCGRNTGRPRKRWKPQRVGMLKTSRGDDGDDCEQIVACL